MAKVKYLPGDTEQFGYVFEAGNSTEVTDEKHLAKFRGNRFFEVTGDDQPVTGGTVDPDALLAKHNGGGRYIITRGDETVLKGLTKDDADVFNAMSDEDKAAYVDKPAV